MQLLKTGQPTLLSTEDNLMPRKLSITLGFDGSETSDYTAIKAETSDGLLFTPTFGKDNKKTIWNPALTGNQIPRYEIHSALEEIFETFQVKRMYCDPRAFESDIEEWALLYGEEVVMKWVTGRLTPMHAALERFRTDLSTGRLTHDGCQITGIHIRNAIRIPKPGEKYMLGKPIGSPHQKIDVAMASVLAHEAAADSRAIGWTKSTEKPKLVFRRR